jgi:hypothetical protein
MSAVTVFGAGQPALQLTVSCRMAVFHHLNLFDNQTDNRAIRLGIQRTFIDLF